MSDFICPQAGDIALVCGVKRTSRFLVYGQRALRSTANFSHCAVNVCGSVWCEAMPTGVRLLTTEEFLQSGHYEENWEVIRMKVGSLNVADQNRRNTAIPGDLLSDNSAWLRATTYFVGQRYNFAAGIPKLKQSETASFCSELVVKVYERMGYKLVGKASELVFPADLEILTDDPCWQKVGNAYRKYFEAVTNLEQTRELAQTYKRILQICSTGDSSFHIARLESFKSGIKLAQILTQSGVKFDRDRYLTELDGIEEGLIASLASSWKDGAKIAKALHKITTYRTDIILRREI